MLTDDQFRELIGSWVVRYSSRDHVQWTRAHLVESVIADRVVTKCGREMQRATTVGILGYAEEHVLACKKCIVAVDGE